MNKEITLQNPKLSFLLFFLFTSWIIYNSFSFFPILENDSFSYINNESIRLSLYPLLIDILNNNHKLIIFFQISYLSLSITTLIYGLMKIRINLFLILIFYLLIVTNVYYTSFSKTILTECIYFASINFCIFFFLIKDSFKQRFYFYFLFGITVGLIPSIRHEGLIIALLASLIFLLKNKLSSLKLLFFFLGLSLMPILENLVFYSKNKERNSVIDKSIFGKIFMMTAFDNESKKNEFTDYIIIFTEKSKKVNYFLESLNNPFLKLNLFSDFQVVAQYQIKDKLNDEDKEVLKKFKNKETKILQFLIKENPIIFLKHTLYNYFSLWMPGGKQVFINQTNNKIPFPDLLEKSQGSLNVENNIIIFLGLIFFTFLFFSFMVFSFSFIYKFFRYPRSRNELNSLLFLIPNLYLIIISFVNVATPRYFMPIYPMILLFIIIELNRIKISRYDF